MLIETSASVVCGGRDEKQAQRCLWSIFSRRSISTFLFPVLLDNAPWVLVWVSKENQTIGMCTSGNESYQANHCLSMLLKRIRDCCRRVLDIELVDERWDCGRNTSSGHDCDMQLCLHIRQLYSYLAWKIFPRYLDEL